MASLISSNAITLGVAAGLSAVVVGVAIGELLNATLLAAHGSTHLGSQSTAVAAILGAALAGLAPLVSGQTARAAKRSGVGGLAAGAAVLVLLPVADVLWRASRDDGSPGDLRIVVAAWLAVGAVVGASTGLVDGPVRARAAMVGGLLGGLTGGLIFVAAAGDFATTEESTLVGRFLGYSATSLTIGLGVGLAERAARSVWISIVDGAAAGRDIIVYRATATIGSGVSADIHLPGDTSVAPEHAVVEIGEAGLSLTATGGAVTVEGKDHRHGPLAAGSVVKVGDSYLRVERR